MKFTATAVSVLKGKALGGFSSSGDIRPGDIAEKIFGEKMGGGNLFAYLFRRFGYPNEGWDPYKNLVSYVLTTPMNGLFLCITPYMGDSTCIHFGVRMTDDVERSMRQVQFKQYERSAAKVHKWASRSVVVGKLSPEEKGKRKVLFAFTDKDNKETGFVMCLCKRGEKPNPRRWLPKLKSKAFGSAMMILGDIYRDLYPESKASKKKRMAKYDLIRKDWRKRPRDFIYKMLRALEASIMDLKTPTYVRDIYINALGRIEDKDVPAGEFSYFKDAGYGGIALTDKIKIVKA